MLWWLRPLEHIFVGDSCECPASGPCAWRSLALQLGFVPGRRCVRRQSERHNRLAAESLAALNGLGVARASNALALRAPRSRVALPSAAECGRYSPEGWSGSKCCRAESSRRTSGASRRPALKAFNRPHDFIEWTTAEIEAEPPTNQPYCDPSQLPDIFHTEAWRPRCSSICFGRGAKPFLSQPIGSPSIVVDSQRSLLVAFGCFTMRPETCGGGASAPAPTMPATVQSSCSAPFAPAATMAPVWRLSSRLPRASLGRSRSAPSSVEPACRKCTLRGGSQTRGGGNNSRCGPTWPWQLEASGSQSKAKCLWRKPSPPTVPSACGNQGRSGLANNLCDAGGRGRPRRRMDKRRRTTEQPLVKRKHHRWGARMNKRRIHVSVPRKACSRNNSLHASAAAQSGV